MSFMQSWADESIELLGIEKVSEENIFFVAFAQNRLAEKRLFDF
jgi:hypothetical protein